MKEIIKRSFKRNIATYDDNAHIQKIICTQLVSMICKQKSSYDKVYEIGAGTGLLTGKLTAALSINEYYINDLVDEMKQYIEKCFECSNPIKWHFEAYDAETTFPPTQFDLITSASTLQWFSNLELFFQRLSKNLSTDGVFAFNTFGINNLKECRALTGKGLKSYDMSEIEDMLIKDYIVLDCYEGLVDLTFDTPLQVLQHLQRTGVNGLKNEFWTKSRLAKFQEEYKQLYGHQDGVLLTYHPQYFVIKKR